MRVAETKWLAVHRCVVAAGTNDLPLIDWTAAMASVVTSNAFHAAGLLKTNLATSLNTPNA